MVYAEIYAGSSQIWFLDPWSLLVTFPLYTFHSIFYLNLAIRFKRTSMIQLYLWGTLFALYEAPITKVLWAGYPGSGGPIFGSILGIASLEFFTLVFFWHPILAFVLPILTVEILLCASSGKIEPTFVSHVNFLKKKKLIGILFFMLASLGSVTFTFNLNFSLTTALIASGGSFLIILIWYKFLIKKELDLRIQDIELTRRGFSLIIFYLVALYVSMWFLLSFDKVPAPITLFITGLIALFFIVVIWLTSPSRNEVLIPSSLNLEGIVALKKSIHYSWLFFLILVPVWCVFSSLCTLFLILIILSLPIVGIAIFTLVLLRMFYMHVKKVKSNG
ncbi:MAG: hypothetical protein ACTSWN_10495 [Promethearchaeota archaeon]